MRRFHFVITMVVACLLSACNHARVQTEESYLGPQMPCPDHVVVSYFSICPQTVWLDQGVSARIVRVVEGQSSTMQQQQAAQAAGVAPAEELVARLRRYGLPAELATEVPQAGRILLVQGRILSVDQGNRTRRMLIGLGAGKSSVTAETQLFYATDSGTPRFMTAFQGEVDSGHMPGAAETIGVGAAAQRMATSAALTSATHAGAETRRTSDAAEAGELAARFSLVSPRMRARASFIWPDRNV